MHTATDRLSIRLLGPFSVLIRGHQITPSAAKQRQVLALLALNAGRVVPASNLIEELWGDAPPRSYATIMQSYIMQLRNQLRHYGVSEQDRRKIIRTHHSGYLLDETACETDANEFSRIARTAWAAGESGDSLRLADLARKALDLWRGPALTDVPVGRHLELELISLDERKLGLLERRIQADLELNRHTDLIGELRTLTFQHSLNENLSAFLMIALYRAGYAARALEEFQRIRFALRTELGIEPAPRLAGIANAVLARDTTLDGHGHWGQARSSAGLPLSGPGRPGGARVVARGDIRGIRLPDGTRRRELLCPRRFRWQSGFKVPGLRLSMSLDPPPPTKREGRLALRILVAEHIRLFRGALVALIGLEPDLEVVADVGRGDDVVGAALELQPDVAIIDASFPDVNGLSAASQLHKSLPSCRTLILTGPSLPGSVCRGLDPHASGYLVKECTPEQLHAAIRNIALGLHVFDARAISPPGSDWAHLSAREHEILQLTADGARPQEIADTLRLSVGTVRNYLTAIVEKLGARSRANAVLKAYTAGMLSLACRRG